MPRANPRRAARPSRGAVSAAGNETHPARPGSSSSADAFEGPESASASEAESEVDSEAGSSDGEPHSKAKDTPPRSKRKTGPSSSQPSKHAAKATPAASSSSTAAPARPLDPLTDPNLPPYTTDPDAFLAHYPVTVNEIGVLTVQPYKQALLPHWRFATEAIARTSAEALWGSFRAYGEKGDFVGMDMARKFIQMGMTRAKRYANYRGGRKYQKDGVAKAKSEGHAGQGEKERASLLFRAYWEDCRSDERYAELKEEFVARRAEYKGERA